MVSGSRCDAPVLKKRAFVTERPVGQLDRLSRLDVFMGAQKLALNAVLTVVAVAPVAVIVSIVAARGAMVVPPLGEVEPRG